MNITKSANLTTMTQLCLGMSLTNLQSLYIIFFKQLEIDDHVLLYMASS